MYFLVSHINTDQKWDGNPTSLTGKEKQKSPSREKDREDEAAYFEEESEFTGGCVWCAKEVASRGTKRSFRRRKVERLAYVTIEATSSVQTEET